MHSRIPPHVEVEIMRDKLQPSIEAIDRSPEKLADLHVTEPLKIAAGIHAIKETMTNAYTKMGPVHATRGLLKLNQKGGIDCQSCAWPDPDEHRTIAEFCESGAKALADEGMSKTIGAEFFAKY